MTTWTHCLSDRRALAIALSLCAALVVASGNAVAQTTAGAFEGTVHDSSGAVLPGATVTATHVGTNAVQTAVTDSQGRYRITQLPLGEYRVEAELEGFRREVNAGLELTLGKTLKVD